MSGRDCDGPCEETTETAKAAEPTLPLASRPVRAMRLVRADGGEERDSTVYCPLLRRSLALSECAECDLFRETVRDENGAPREIRCSSRYRDVAREVATPFERANPALVRVGELVRGRDVTCVTPEVTSEQVAQLFLERDLSFVPVIGGSGAVLGVVSKTDLVREGARADVCAGEILSPLVWKVEERATLREAIDLMVEHRIHQVPVVSTDGDIVGVLGALDVVRWLADGEVR